jgi:hypothetical protein
MKTKYQKLQMTAAAFFDHKRIYPSREDEEMLDRNTLKSILDKYAPGVDVQGDGVYGLEWLSTDTFYRHTVDYVAVEQRLAYKFALEAAFPGKKAVL